jgi:hypothetical protein
LWVAGIVTGLAVLVAGAAALFGVLRNGHLPWTSADHAWMAFQAMIQRGPSPLHVGTGPVWVGVAALVTYLAATVEWTVFLLWQERTIDAWVTAMHEDCGIGSFDPVEILEYGNHLTLLRRAGGRYSFAHDRFRDYFQQVSLGPARVLPAPAE